MLALALWAGFSGSTFADSCVPSGAAASIEEIVVRVETDRIKYVFVGERHAIGPVKRFTVDLANALVDRGHDVGLYVEGFRMDCSARDQSCRSLVRDFNEPAFLTLAGESKAAVHGIDPPGVDRRAARMAARVAAGSESIRIVLVGKAHVVHAENRAAEFWIFGGGMKYADPGDLAETFASGEYLTLGLEVARDVGGAYALRADGCTVDYSLATDDTREYWSPEPAARRLDQGAGRR